MMAEASSSQVNAVARAVNQVSRDLQAVGQMQVALQNRVDYVAANQDQTRTELNQLASMVLELSKRLELEHNHQLAQTEIVEVKQELESRFGHFALVRRLATGTLQAMDTKIITQETLQSTSEELMVTTPGYWLAPALVGLAAWIRDDQDLAQRALREALRRDNDRTSLFFTLVLRRQGRNQAAARWLRQYLVRQDPAALSYEFVVVLDAAATGALGPDARPLVMEQLGTWYDRLAADGSVVEAQVDKWRQLIDELRTQIDPRFTVLPEVSPTWPALKEIYEGATVHRAAEQRFRAILDRPVGIDTSLQERIDTILDNLVTSFDREETPLRKRADELEAVIRHGGDKAAATATAAASASLHEAHVDLLTLITNAGFFPDRVGASPITQRLAIALARDWIVEADGRLEAENVRALPAAVELEVEGWTGVVNEHASEAELVASVCAHIDAETEQEMAAVKFDGAPMASAIGAGAAVLMAILSAVNGGGGFAGFLLIVAVALGGYAGHGYTRLQPRRDHIRALGEQRKATATAKVRGAVAEVVDWRMAWEQELTQARSCRNYLATIDRDAFVIGSPDQQREVVL